MTPLEFAWLWRGERDSLLSAFLDPASESPVAAAVANLDLTAEQAQGLREVLSSALTDTMYTLLLGLDGCGSIGGRQERYRLFSQGGEPLSGDGELEAAAWEVFHGKAGGSA